MRGFSFASDVRQHIDTGGPSAYCPGRMLPSLPAIPVDRPTEPADRCALGARLLEARLTAGWTVDQAADAAGVTRNTIRNWELGRVEAPYLATVRLLSAYEAAGGVSEPVRPLCAGIAPKGPRNGNRGEATAE